MVVAINYCCLRNLQLVQRGVYMQFIKRGEERLSYIVL